MKSRIAIDNVRQLANVAYDLLSDTRDNTTELKIFDDMVDHINSLVQLCRQFEKSGVANEIDA